MAEPKEEGRSSGSRQGKRSEPPRRGSDPGQGGAGKITSEAAAPEEPGSGGATEGTVSRSPTASVDTPRAVTGQPDPLDPPYAERFEAEYRQRRLLAPEAAEGRGAREDETPEGEERRAERADDAPSLFTFPYPFVEGPEDVEAAPFPQIPTQFAVDRSEPLERFRLDIPIVENDRVIQVLRFPPFGRTGPDPAEPPAFSRRSDASHSICSILAPRAALQCRFRGRV